MGSVNEKLLKKIYKYIGCFDASVYRDAFSCIRNIGTENDRLEVQLAHELRDKMKPVMNEAKNRGNTKFREQLYMLNRDILCYCAPDVTDDYILYMECDRPYDKQFYLPRRKQLKPIADALDRLERRELEILGISMPPGTGKTSIAEFFLTRCGGKNPELPILVGSHSNSFLRGMYGEILRFLSPNGEYKFNDVFPNVHVINTNAQDMMIDLGADVSEAKRFMTFEFSSIGSGNAGKVRAANILYCDDLVDGLEAALSRERMDKLYQTYATDLRQRKIGSCVELHIATRWSVHDVVGQLARMNENNPKALFITKPALNENDESNFDYPIPAGFTTKFYLEQREAMDDASWRALYQNQPIEREGLLYEEQQLRRYFDLPDGEPDAIISVCDTKDKGIDYCVMPIAYQYGNDYYIEDVVDDNSNPEIVEPRLIQKCLEHEIHFSRFESNAAGGKVAEKVQSEIKAKGGRTKITTKYSTQNKETRIIMSSPWVLQHCLFKDSSVIKDNKEYRHFVNAICSYTMVGKNKHDDEVDALSMLADYAQGFSAGRAEIIRSPFRR